MSISCCSDNKVLPLFASLPDNIFLVECKYIFVVTKLPVSVISAKFFTFREEINSTQVVLKVGRNEFIYQLIGDA